MVDHDFGLDKYQEREPSSGSYPKGGARFLAAVTLFALSFGFVPKVEAQTVITDNGRFPQCVSLSASHRERLLNESSLLKTLSRETKYIFYPSLTEYYCLPDMTGPSRYLIQTGVRNGLPLPTGDSSEDIISIDLPEDVDPIVLVRYGKKLLSDVDGETQEWLFFNLRNNQEITFTTADGNSITARGSLALLSEATFSSVNVNIKYIEPKVNPEPETEEFEEELDN